jgi:aryl-alcohol dehydrogenase-like predicted oxidoreductase
MDYVNLGKTGLKVSRICLGCMTYGQPATGKIKPGSHAWALNEEESQPFLRQSRFCPHSCRKVEGVSS